MLRPSNRFDRDHLTWATNAPLIWGAEDGDDAGEGGGEDSGDEGGKGDSGKEGDERDKILTQTREEMSKLKRKLESKTEEAKRVHTKYEDLLKKLGSDDEIAEFTKWKANAAKAEEERARREGEFDKLLAARDKRIAELENELKGERTDRSNERIVNALVSSSSKAKVNDPEFVAGYYRDAFEVRDGKVVHKSEVGENGQMTVDEFLTSLRANDAKAWLFQPNAKDGTGAAPGGTRDTDQGSRIVIHYRRGQVASPDDQARYDKAVKDDRPGHA
jgi:hypothetical protein